MFCYGPIILSLIFGFISNILHFLGIDAPVFLLQTRLNIIHHFNPSKWPWYTNIKSQIDGTRLLSRIKRNLANSEIVVEFINL